MGADGRGRRLRLAVTATAVAAAVTALAATTSVAAPAAAVSNAATSATSAGAAGGPLARTTAGTVRGTRSGPVDRYLGVPYAAPPVGDLRWRSPRPAPAWTGVRPAVRQGAPCAQAADVSGASEDCLHVDVTAPHRRAGGRPVMVWLHGGGFSVGTGNEVDPSRMAAQGGVVVVTVDFRLGVFGLFGTRGLPGSGTFTLQDQQAALRWVRANAAAFGGDPRDVTLFGQSGGAIGACAQLTSPGSAGLFDRVVLQSGSCATNAPAGGLGHTLPPGTYFDPVREVVRAGHEAARTLGCARHTPAAELRCLRALPASTLLQSPAAAGFAHAATGTATLPLDPAAAIRAGRFHRVPVISGHTRDELRFEVAYQRLQGIPLDATAYRRRLADDFGTDQVDRIARRYPPATTGDSWQRLYDAYSDAMFTCPQIETSDALARHVPTYAYEFADEHAPSYAPVPASFPAGASHASELMYLFDIAGKPVDLDGHPLAYTAAQRRLGATMIGYWTHFARHGRPGAPGSAPVWHRARPGHAGATALALAPGRHGVDGIAPTDAAARHHCAFWRTVPTR